MRAVNQLPYLSFVLLLSFPAVIYSQGVDVTRYIETGGLVVAPVIGANSFQVYSKQSGTWANVEFPDGIEAEPIVDQNVCTFILTGNRISTLVAVDVNGKVVTTELPKPAERCTPIISGKFAVFVVDGQAYAFSGEVGTWDSMECPVTPHLLNGCILIVAPDWIGAFSAKTGKWSVARTRVQKTHP